MNDGIESTINPITHSKDDDKKHRTYFNSVTGEIMTNEIDEKERYTIDEDDQREQDENQIDQYTDVSSQDKKFFKLWNRFIHSKY